jgi:hypothetical protein
VADKLKDTPPPTAAELAVIRELDPDHFWTALDQPK